MSSTKILSPPLMARIASSADIKLIDNARAIYPVRKLPIPKPIQHAPWWSLGLQHFYIDSSYTRQLGLPLRHAGRMSVIAAGAKHPTLDRYKVWVDGWIQGISGSYATTTSWYTLLDLKGGI